MKNSTKLLFVGLAIILAVLIVGAGYIYNKYHEMKSVYSSTLVHKEMNTFRDFNALHLEVSSDIELMQGDFKVQVEGDSLSISGIKWTISDSVLTIDEESTMSRNNNFTIGPKIKLSMPDLKFLSLESSGSLTMAQRFDCDSLNLRLSGSGDIISQIHGNYINIDLIGSGMVTNHGEIKSAALLVKGSGDIFMGDDPIETCNLELVGSGNMHFNCSGKLTGVINGSGSIYNSGSAKSEVVVNGSGEVH